MKNLYNFSEDFRIESFRGLYAEELKVLSFPQEHKFRYSSSNPIFKINWWFCWVVTYMFIIDKQIKEILGIYDLKIIHFVVS
jgi:hypothetical protein